MEYDVEGNDGARLVEWADELARGVGVPNHQLESLRVGIRHAVLHAATDGASFDRVAVARSMDTVEVELIGTVRRDSFLLQM